MYQVIDTTTNDIVSEHATWRKTFNETRKLEPEPSLRKPGFRDPQWRYLIRNARCRDFENALRFENEIAAAKQK